MHVLAHVGAVMEQRRAFFVATSRTAFLRLLSREVSTDDFVTPFGSVHFSKDADEPIAIKVFVESLRMILGFQLVPMRNTQ